MAQTLAGLDITKDDPEFVQAVNENGAPCFGADGNPIMISGKGFNSKRIVDEFRKQNPKIIALWKQLDTGFKNSVGGTFEMELPSGRVMRYDKIRQERRLVKDEENPTRVKSKLVYTTDIGGRRYSAYGGLLCENLTQAVARDIFAKHLLALDETPGINVLFSCHDEAIVEADENITAKDVEKIMSIAPDWIPGLPVASEAQEVPHYTK